MHSGINRCIKWIFRTPGCRKRMFFVWLTAESPIFAIEHTIVYNNLALSGALAGIERLLNADP